MELMSAYSQLPPEMQQRIAAIMAGNQTPAETPHQAAIAAQPTPPAPVAAPGVPPAPIQKPPSLMDHLIALRTEVAELRQQNIALMQTSEAVGSAVQQMYEMFSPAQGIHTSNLLREPNVSRGLLMTVVTEDRNLTNIYSKELS